MDFVVLKQGQDEFGFDVRLIKDSEGYTIYFERKNMNFHFGSDRQTAEKQYNELVYSE
jgi:hypothetical protein